MLLPVLASPPFKSKIILKRSLKARKPSVQVLGSLCQVTLRELVDVVWHMWIFPSLVLFYEGNLVLFFLNPFNVKKSEHCRQRDKMLFYLKLSSLPPFILSTRVS